jgi:predicted acetyltransferase
MPDIRTITDADAEQFRRRLALGFGNDPDSDTASVERFQAIFEFDRTFAAFDGDDIIGTAAGFSLGLTVPGGAEVPMAGTTVIAVQPTHRRRGVFRALMESHLDDVASREEPLAGLWASESSIYGRFGYGPATYRHSIAIETGSIAFRDEQVKGSTRLLGAPEAEPIVRDLYEKARTTRAGFLSRSDAWWVHRVIADPESWRGGKSSNRYVVFEEDGSPTGYASYRQKAKWEDFAAGGEIDVSEVIATTAASHAGIWSFLTNIDLYTDLEYWNLPVDDALPFEITAPRRVRSKLVDGLWVRLMDVTAALEARAYETDGGITFDLIDASRPHNTGTYRLDVADGRGHCERVSSAAEATFDTDVMGHLYLGGGNARAMAGAGRVEGDPESVGSLHRLFHTSQAPWCPEVF